MPNFIWVYDTVEWEIFAADKFSFLFAAVACQTNNFLEWVELSVLVLKNLYHQ